MPKIENSSTIDHNIDVYVTLVRKKWFSWRSVECYEGLRLAIADVVSGISSNAGNRRWNRDGKIISLWQASLFHMIVITGDCIHILIMKRLGKGFEQRLTSLPSWVAIALD